MQFVSLPAAIFALPIALVSAFILFLEWRERKRMDELRELSQRRAAQREQERQETENSDR